MSNKGISIRLKSKALKENRSSYFLHIYDQVSKKRRREYLGLYFFTKPKTAIERNHNQETKGIAETVFSKRILEAQEGRFGFIQKEKIEIPLLSYFSDLISKREAKTSKSNVSSWKSMMTHLRQFTRDDIRLSQVDENFLNEFKEYLLTVSLQSKVD